MIILMKMPAYAAMKWKGWEKVPLTVPDPGIPGATRVVDAIAPLIVSASRSTDIPAFYGDWFMNRLAAGYVRWKSPFGGNDLWVSFAQTRVFVFWSKNPAPFLPFLPALDKRKYLYYFLFTLNDYHAEHLEPNVPSLDERIGTFIRLSRALGKGRVVWRFDPLILSDRLAVPDLLERIGAIGDRIASFTERMIFSFADISKYPKVGRNLKAGGFAGAREFTAGEAEEFCTGLAALNRDWGLSVTACAEGRDFSRFGIGKGQCISADLMVREFGTDAALMDLLKPANTPCPEGASGPWRRLKDPGQRGTCGCIVSKDIGQYSTCPHGCVYCYANSSPERARRNFERFTASLLAGEAFRDTIT